MATTTPRLRSTGFRPTLRMRCVAPRVPVANAYLMVLINPRTGRVVDACIMSDPNPTVIHSMGVWARVCAADGTGRTYDEAYHAVERNLRNPWLAWVNRFLRRSKSP